jgi:primary-amine oxidase
MSNRCRCSLAVVALLVLTAMRNAAGDAATHPLDPLSEAEINAVRTVLRADGKVDDDTRYPMVTLMEPPKAEVLAWKAGDPIPRHASAVVKKGPQTFEAVIDLTGGKVESWKQVEGQPSILLEEFIGAGEIVKSNPGWQAAMRKRGFESFDQIICLPATSGYYGIADEEGRRVVRLICFDKAGGTQNFWGRPIEGLVPVVDVNKREVIKLLDFANVPVPQNPVDYDDKSVGSVRAQTPITCEQPQGVTFVINGSEVTWQSWSFHLRMDPRRGPVISLLRYDDGGKQRSILYEGSLSELFVPYQDPDQNWYFRTYLDPGEYGLGKLAGSLKPGADCPPTAQYIGDWLADDKGTAQGRERIACIFERQTGDPAWRHYDLIADQTDGRTSRELVVRVMAAVGNYDYVFDWILHQDGTIKVAIGATGILEVKAVPESTTPTQAEAYGHVIAKQLVGVYHDHFFSYRLDLDVDGPENSFLREDLKIARLGPKDGPRKSVWVVEPKLARVEQDGQLHMNMEKPSRWRVINPKVLGPTGHPVSYELRTGHNSVSMLAPDDWPARRAGFTAHHLWITPYQPDELYAAGTYPNESKGGDGLPKWTKANRPIADTDIVLWYTIGFHHLVRVEDWPVMPTSWHEFELVPIDFFTRNPALDLPKDATP